MTWQKKEKKRDRGGGRSTKIVSSTSKPAGHPALKGEGRKKKVNQRGEGKGGGALQNESCEANADKKGGGSKRKT